MSLKKPRVRDSSGVIIRGDAASNNQRCFRYTTKEFALLEEFVDESS